METLLTQLAEYLQTHLQFRSPCVQAPCVKGVTVESGRVQTCVLVLDTTELTLLPESDFIAIHDGSEFHLYSWSAFPLPSSD